jgi:hypothetical protein
MLNVRATVDLSRFQQTLTAVDSSITATNFDQKLSQTIFDKCVSKEIFHELPHVIDINRVDFMIVARHLDQRFFKSVY